VKVGLIFDTGSNGTLVVRAKVCKSFSCNEMKQIGTITSVDLGKENIHNLVMFAAERWRF
jgi:hypothetical protein